MQKTAMSQLPRHAGKACDDPTDCRSAFALGHGVAHDFFECSIPNCAEEEDDEEEDDEEEDDDDDDDDDNDNDANDDNDADWPFFLLSGIGWNHQIILMQSTPKRWGE